MSGPEFEGVLAGHLPRDRYRPDGESDGTYCTGCDWTGDYFADGEAGPFDAHLSAALHTELARWLGDEGTREVVARAVHSHQEYSTCWDDETAGPTSPLGTEQRRLDEHSRDFYRALATAALAALTTTDQEDR